MSNWIEWVESVIVAAVCAISCRYYLHMFQLESYQLDGYKRWLSKNREGLMGFSLTLAVAATGVSLLGGLLLRFLMGETWGRAVTTIVTLGGFIYAAYVLFNQQYKAPEKKPLALTPRMKRLIVCAFVVTVVAANLVSYLGVPPYILYVALAYIVMVAGYIMQPIEKMINNWYKYDAEDRLEKRADLIKIGITGSYGKTSTKFILAAILSEKYDVLATPSSFNTPMGLTRVIREQLEPHHQVFLAEMGARHVGDIKELVELVKPKYGVLTSVGAQHLETFGNVETVANTKYELIEGLPQDGVAFFGKDGEWVDKLYARCKIEKYCAGLSGGFKNMYAEDITVGPEGSSFTLCTAEGERVACKTRMLGMHNIGNIVLACMVGKRLGMTMDEVARGVNKTEPVEHRLQLIKNPNGVTVIDDAFNSNPVGAKAALDVLRDFPGRRVIVTPGMVEGGEDEAALNYTFGSQMYESCDVIILVGKKRTEPIRKGALDAGFDAAQLYPVGNLTEATQLLAHIGKPNDVVLFENDLPDNYSE